MRTIVLVGLAWVAGGAMADLQRVPQPVDHNDFRIMYWGRWAPVGKLAELATKNGTNVWANDLP